MWFLTWCCREEIATIIVRSRKSYSWDSRKRMQIGGLTWICMCWFFTDLIHFNWLISFIKLLCISHILLEIKTFCLNRIFSLNSIPSGHKVGGSQKEDLRQAPYISPEKSFLLATAVNTSGVETHEEPTNQPIEVSGVFRSSQHTPLGKQLGNFPGVFPKSFAYICRHILSRS